ncbi:MAG: hypothetical protein PHO67_07065 [Candidatus Omnitrophica bacterium]|nr:hypothetical protein [Candidatus Omnitrophota bacterium]
MVNKTILLLLFISLICGCSYASNAISENPSPNPANKNIESNNTPSDISNLIEEKIDAKIGKLKDAYLENGILSNKQYLDSLGRIENNVDTDLGRIWKLLSAVGIVIAILGIFGFSNLAELYRSIHRAKGDLDQTGKLYKTMENKLRQQSQELEERYGYLTDPSLTTKIAPTLLDENKFLNYDHQLYFMPVFLPITKNFNLYKNSLLKIGIFFLWQGNYARAILRFEEIEKLTEIEHKKFILGKNILGDKTDVFLNAYGNACSYYATEKCTKGSSEWNEYIVKAEDYYKKSIKINKFFQKPYYNLGLLYAVDKYNLDKNKENCQKALEYYTLGLKYTKEPNDVYAIKWNMACSKVKLEAPIEEVMELLESIPVNNHFWPKIQEDSVFNPIKSTPEWRALITRKTSN